MEVLAARVPGAVRVRAVAEREGLLLEADLQVVLTLAASALAVASLAVVTCAWLVGPAAWPERVLARIAALALLYLKPLSGAIGVAAFAAAVVVHLVLRRTGAAASLGARAG